MTETDQLLPILMSDATVQAAYCFGSRSRGEGGPESDLDIAVMLTGGLDERAVWNKRLELGALLSEACAHEVDLFVVGDSDLDLTFRVFRDGQRIYERDRSSVREMEARMVSLYYDYQPFLADYLERTAEHFRSHG